MTPRRTSILFAVLLALAATGAAAHAAKRGAPAPRVHPKITGKAIRGRTLHATRGRWRNLPRRYRYAWLECNRAGKRCHAIRRARARTYKLAGRDVGHRIRVAVTASNPRGSTRALSRATLVVVEPAGAPPPPAPPPPPPPPPPPGRVVLTEDLGWTPVPTASLPWDDINQLILFNLATSNGPALNADNLWNVNVPIWVAAAHSHPGVMAIIAIGGSDNSNWSYACNNANRAQFVQNLVGFATSNGFDGIDLDIEDGVWMSMSPPVAAMTTCVEAISTAAHAAGLRLSGDVITNWDGPWWAPSQAYVDQYNLMTFGSNLATMQQDVADTIDQGLPAAKFVVGVDVSEHPQPPAGCGQFAHYATQAGLLGSFVWEAYADYGRGNICADGLAAG